MWKSHRPAGTALEHKTPSAGVVACQLQALQVRVQPGVAQQHGQAQAHQLFNEQVVVRVQLQFAQLTPVTQHQLAQTMKLRQCKAWRVGVVQDVGPMFVVIAVRDQAANFMQLRGPMQLALHAG